MVIAEQVLESAYLTGEFLLRSGATSSFYFDKYRFESRPEILTALAAEMLRLVGEDVEFLAGLELGGVPIATAMSIQSGIPALFVRKEAKSYGSCKAVEGAEIQGSRVCLVEDVVTTGGALLDAARLVSEAGGEVSGVVCAVQRQALKPEVDRKLDVRYVVGPMEVEKFLRTRQGTK